MSITITAIDSGERDTPDVYVRWITARQAMEHPCLQCIPTDVKPLRSSTTISDLKNIVIHRVYMARDSTEDVPPPNTTAELFLFDCHLAANDSSTTLAGLGDKT